MVQLSHKTVYPPVQTVTIDFVKPLSYEFRVIEHMNPEGKVVRASLQVQVWEHDENGYGNVLQTWNDVPRYKMDHNGVMVV